MELRHCSHLHYISAIRGGEQIKLLNVTRGKPSLKFRSIQEIYDWEDSEEHDSLAIPKVDRSMAVLRSNNAVKIEPMEGQDMVDNDHICNSKSIAGDDKRDSCLDDWDIGEMSLKQLKDACKSKKRKSSRPTDKTNRYVPKQECVHLQGDEDDLDLEETLISWKLKGSNKSKSKKKRKLGHLFSKSEQLPGGQGCKQFNVKESGGSISIKVEQSEPDFSHGLDTTPLCCDSSLRSRQRCSEGGERSEVLETLELGFAAEEQSSFSEAAQVSGCSQVFIGHLVQAGCSNTINVHDGSSPTSQQNAFLVPKTSKILEFTEGCSTLISEESEVCGLNQVSHEHLQHSEGSSPLSESLKSDEMELDRRYIKGDQFLLLRSPAFTRNDQGSGIWTSEESQEMNFMVCGHTGYGQCPVYSDDDEIPLQIQGPSMTVANYEYADQGEYCEAFSFVDNNKCPDSTAQVVGTLVNDGPCSLNQVCYQHVQHTEDASPLSGSFNSKEMIELDDVSLKGDQLLLLPSPALTEESQETSFLRCASYEYCGSPDYSDEIPLQIQGPCMIAGTSASVEQDGQCKGYTFDDNRCPYSIPQALGRTSGDSALYSEQCLDSVHEVVSTNRETSLAQVAEKDLHDCEATMVQKVSLVSPNCEATLHDEVKVLSQDNDALINEKRESSVHVNAAPGVCFPDNHPSDVTNKVTRKATDNYDQLQPQHPPERLFSARKMISPTSQIKLCRAMRNTELDDDRTITKSKEKDSIEKQGKISGSNNIDEVDITPKRSVEVPSNNKQIAQKRFGDKKSLRLKGNSKSPSSSQVQRFSSGCRSIQTCSESAISFSQQQMHDIERLALTLATELESMRHTVTDILQVESRTAAALRFNANKAIEHATKTEETAKKWLSIMARDCNRFCKIMKMSQKEVASPGKNIHQESTEKVASPTNRTPKGRKKIMFADEAGGNLCDIKMFKVDSEGLYDGQLPKEAPLAS